ncbi:MAG TPA: hypothetical protein VFB63_35015 [Bryobacteraceae bacterium]|nr:hypothetical protein [Bryobacteraceae bacterium]
MRKPPVGSCERGAVPTLWRAAALGLMDGVEAYFVLDTPLSRPTLRTRSGVRAMEGSG